MHMKKVGGIWFLKVWRLQVSFSIAKTKKKKVSQQLTFPAYL